MEDMKFMKRYILCIIPLFFFMPFFGEVMAFGGLRGDFLTPGIHNGDKAIGIGGGGALEGGVYIDYLSLGLIGGFHFTGDSEELVESLRDIRLGLEVGYDFDNSLIKFFPDWLAIRPNVAVLADWYNADGFRSKSKKQIGQKEKSEGITTSIEPSLFVDIVDLIKIDNFSIIPNLGFTEQIRIEQNGPVLTSIVSLGARVVYRPKKYSDFARHAGNLNVYSTLKDDLFTPDNDGAGDTVEFSVVTDADEHGGVATWELRIYDPGTRVFYTQQGTGEIPSPFVWDGTNIRNDEIQSGALYQYVWYVRAEDGFEGYVPGIITTGIMVRRNLEGNLNISLSSITFGPNSSKFDNLKKDEIKRNNELFDQLADILKNFSDYNVTVEGHANNVSGTEREHVKELLPLSQARAETVCRELEIRGISKDRLIPVGRGSEKMVTNKKEDAWKNRRVEFILIKKE